MSQATLTLPADAARIRHRAILSCAIGNFFELFDFVLYGFFAVPISHAFFPPGNDTLALINTFITFGVGFLFRPLGAVIIGRYGDRHGRRAALVVTIGLMAAATGFTGLVPTYAQVGLLAPLLLLVCRCGQGFSTGGEWGGAAAFLVEYAQPGKRGLTGSWQQFSTQVGATGASLSAYLLATYLAPDAFSTWGWRVPFVLGFVLGPIGYYLRTRVAETPVFERNAEQHALSHAPLTEAWGNYRGKIIQAFGLSIIGIVGNYVMIVYMATYAIKTLHIDAASALLCTTLANVVVMVLTPLTGALSDRVGRRPMIAASGVLYLILAYPLYRLLGAGTVQVLLIAQLIVAVIQSLYTGTIPVILAEMFPTRVRYTALSVSYGFSVAIFGGFSPFVAAWLISATGSPLSPAWLVMAAGAASVISIWSMTEHRNAPLD
ncbi:MAG TPA: MFS transporter [Acetobacteraceae bacterium]|jgi:MHS family proline/betaine transporter-like MFS transporter|nr:MFS transporter [Acetobacteraceae bacterium]